VRAGFALLLAALVLFAAVEVNAQSVRPPGNAVNLEDGIAPGPSNTLGDRSDSDMWRDFRGGDPNRLLRPETEGNAMQTSGQHWRLLREQYIRKYAGYFPLGVIAILLLFHLIKGKMRIKAGRAGTTIPRFTSTQRVAHWFMAAVFIILEIGRAHV